MNMVNLNEVDDLYFLNERTSLVALFLQFLDSFNIIFCRVTTPSWHIRVVVLPTIYVA